MYWDRFDICLAWYHYATLYHGGQWSAIYAVFGRLESLGFRPGLAAERLDRSDHGNARSILASLIRRTRAGVEVVRA